MAQIYISLGSNLNPKKYLQAGLQSLSLVFSDLVQSSIYESEAVGFKGNNYLNMVVSAVTEYDVAETVAVLKQIELDHGRQPNVKKSKTRTLDLDLLLYDELVTTFPIELPRADIVKHAFVLLPLTEIASTKRHPSLKHSYAKLWADFDHDSQKIWRITFNFPV